MASFVPLYLLSPLSLSLFSFFLFYHYYRDLLCNTAFIEKRGEKGDKTSLSLVLGMPGHTLDMVFI